MMEWKSSSKLISFSILLVLLITGCAGSGKLKDANQYQKQKKYIQAIILYDQFIERHSHSAEETIAELKRSDCYYELGLQAYSGNRFELAERLLFLANSQEADKVLDNVHFKLAQIAAREGDKNKQLKHYSYIADYINSSELMSRVLLNRIKILLQKKQKVAAYNDYKWLWDDFADSPQADSATTLIDPVIPEFLENSQRNKENGYYAAAIAEFLVYADYPSSFYHEIIAQVADSYYLWALDSAQKKDYTTAQLYFNKALDYLPALQSKIDDVRYKFCQKFINTADSLKQEGKLQDALKEYEKCFIFIPDMSLAQEKIQSTQSLKIKFAQADSIYKQAEFKENRNEYSAAEKLFREVYELNNSKTALKKADEMRNYINAQNKPRDFALEIIRDFNNGIIIQNVNQTYYDLVELFGDQVTTTDWKAMYSFGEFKYEVRMDILSPEINYYFAWRVHLIDRTIDPLNKASEEMMVNKNEN